MNSGIALELQGSVLDARAVTYGKLAGASITRTFDDKSTSEAVPVALDILTDIMDIPRQRTLA